MNRLSSFTVIVSFVCLSLMGLALIPMLPVKLNPSRSLPGFTVSFSMPGASSRVVEMEVTSKLEGMLARIRGIKNLNSTSGNGYGQITVDLDKHADVDAVRFEASTIIRQTWSQLPDGVSYPTIRMKVPEESADRPFISFTLNAPSTPILIQRYAEEQIKPRLARLQGIYKIEVSGATPMEWRLEYDGENLRQLGITVDDITSAIRQYYEKEFLGIRNMEVGQGKEQWIRVALMPLADNHLFNPSLITVTCLDGKLVRLDELVTVTHTEEEPQSYYRINGLNSIYLSITAEEAVNQLELSEAIYREMEQIERLLPPGYEVHPSYDATEYIRAELDKIYFRTALTVFILLAFVWLTTRRSKYLFLIVTSLTVNVAVALIFYYLFGLEMQLYSLAGITVSLNLIIDSTIVMTDHILHRRNLKAFMSILAATLTTMGALVIIFFLDEKLRLNLQDFAAVVIINLAVSLFVALFFVPAMMKQTGMLSATVRCTSSVPLTSRLGKMGSFLTSFLRFTKRFPVYFNHFYVLLIRFLCRWRSAVCVLLVLAFGLPIFLLPEKLEGEGRWIDLYNNTLGSSTYKENIKPIVDKALGGTLRLFVQDVYSGSYFSRNEEVVLTANANLPNGSTLQQMNTLIKRMETYLSEFSEIRQFHTSIYNARRATIQIYFKKEAQHSGFPYMLKSNMISRALQLGGGSWGIYGLQDQGFNNDVRESAGSYRITLYGYNYDELYGWAEQLKERLLRHRRIKEVLINSEYSWWKDDYQEFFFNLDRDRMIRQNVDANTLYSAVRPIFGRNIDAGRVVTQSGTERIHLSSRQSRDYDIWAMQFSPHYGHDSLQHYKLASLAEVVRRQTPQNIAKENQQYRLCVQYEYIGSGEMGRKVQKQDVDEFNDLLPMGYVALADSEYDGWSSEDSRGYLLLLVVVGIIFFTTSILFNSLRQPLAIIFVIPLSYIGVFLTFFWFGLNFDQGGFASFVLLCGITVNASIYIVSEYNALRRSGRLSCLRAYVKAFSCKLLPIFLTVISTVLGFVPFLVGTHKEGFWFPLAAGTIGGLLMSVVAIFLFLPLFLLPRKQVLK
ncbi:MAG: efflux RND transporter permease subunit [Mediterranea massiliensis]|nr:efflux RND transporter permease subunit [Mediterranea massiliensis]